MSPSHVLFVTGKLAEPALRRTLAAVELPCRYSVTVMKITVAALMTTEWIAKFLQVPADVDLVMIPGLCEGDEQVLARATGVPVEKGPKDLREIPRRFGRGAPPAEYGAHTIEIVAEINNAPKLAPEIVYAAADYFHDAGADIIDIGCTNGVAFPGLAEVVRELRARERRVSVDTFDAGEIRVAVAAGAELVLSINSSNRDVASDLAGTSARAVIVPDPGGTIDTLEPTMRLLENAGVPYLLDPILEPIGFGLMASLQRYAEVRRRYPDAEMLMGIGNVTELTAADSTGLNALLIALCEELQVRAVLTTEVIPWAHGSVREIDAARQLMHYAISQGSPPKGIDNRLVTVKDPSLLTYTEDELRELQAGITDPNYRIFADPDAVTIFNNKVFVSGRDIEEMFDRLGVNDAAHAFYLGMELERARLAMWLRKTYRQDSLLSWGYLTPPSPRGPHRGSQ